MTFVINCDLEQRSFGSRRLASPDSVLRKYCVAPEEAKARERVEAHFALADLAVASEDRTELCPGGFEKA